MLERLLLPDDHAIAILIKDHDTVKRLFEQFEKATARAERERIIGEALAELKIHATIEEETFYPTVRAHVGSKLMNEADEEHHIARVLVAELDRDGGGHDHRDAKFTVLAESIRHHIKEEEREMLPKARELSIDFEALGRRMLERKQRLKETGVPADAEHAMVAAVNGRTDTPAATARRRAPVRRRTTKAKRGMKTKKKAAGRRQART